MPYVNEEDSVTHGASVGDHCVGFGFVVNTIWNKRYFESKGINLSCDL